METGCRNNGMIGQSIKENEIPARFRDVELALDRLISNISNLEGRLGPILGLSRPSDCGKEKMQTQTEMGTRLSDIAETINMQASKITDMVERVQL